jgi:hypothetical protein
LATHYQALGVSPDAEAEVIQGAYRALMRKYHPDTNGGAYSDARAKRINQAYATLSDPAARAAYDARLRAADRPSRPEPAGPSAWEPGPEPERTSPSQPFNEFTSPPPKTRAKGLSWRLTALITVALAGAGLATGRLIAAAPAHETLAAAEPPPAPASAPAPPSLQALAAKARVAASADQALAAVVSGEIVPRWHADCSATADDLYVDLQVTLTRDGALIGARPAGGGGGDTVKLASATERAKLAVEQAAPFNLPPESYRQWRVFIVRFDTKDVCAARAAGNAQGSAAG